jgi:hypothetical protein
MPIAGFERPFQVRAQLEALEHERKSHIYDARHLAEIEKQEVLFRTELLRMEREGVEDEEATTNKAMGTTAYVGVPGVDRGRIV